MESRTIFSYRQDKKIKSKKAFAEVGLTKPEFAASCNINNMLARHRKTGLINVSRVAPVFGDFSADYDLREAMDTIISAKDQFYNLPSAIRKKFDNDPLEFMEFLQVASEDQMREVGIIRNSEELLKNSEEKETEPQQEITEKEETE